MSNRHNQWTGVQENLFPAGTQHRDNVVFYLSFGGNVGQRSFNVVATLSFLNTVAERVQIK